MKAAPIQICPHCLGTRTEPDIPCRRPHPARSRAEHNARARQAADTGTDQQRAAAALAAVTAAVRAANRRRYQQP